MHKRENAVDDALLFEQICGRLNYANNVDQLIQYDRVWQTIREKIGQMKSGQQTASILECALQIDEILPVDQSTNDMSTIDDDNNTLCAPSDAPIPNATDDQLIVNKNQTTGKFLCEDCGKTFRHRKYLDRHKRSVHAAARQFKCNENGCEKTFTVKSSLDVHNRSVHKKECKYECDMCKRRFFAMQRMLAHRRVHTKERPHKCDECTKAYRTPNQLATHKRLHNGTAFVCHVCGKLLASTTLLLSHEAVHTNERPYACEVDGCGQMFKSLQAKQVHQMRVHTSEKPTTKYWGLSKSINQLDSAHPFHF
jgi:hypothetical protein